MVLDIAVIWLAIGLIGGAIALYRGINAPAAFVGTLLLGPFGLVGALVVPPGDEDELDEEDGDECGRCGEPLRGPERFCPRCGEPV